MTSFAKASFDVAGYLAARPTYPARIYETILSYHSPNGRFDRALDLGCGPGFIAHNLAPHFKHTIGLDPSRKMVDIGLQPDDKSVPRIDYRVGGGEDLVAAGVAGVDLVVAGQAAHWFDHPKTWAQLSKAVKPGGTVAYIGYAELLFPNHPNLSHYITHHSSHPTQLGPYWSQPGRSIVENLLNAVPFPTQPTPPQTISLPDLNGTGTGTSDLHPEMIPEPTLHPPLPEAEQVRWEPSFAIRLKSGANGEKWLMTNKFTKSSLEAYLRTWSSLHAYHEANPDDLAKRGKGMMEGDIVDRVMGKIWAGREEDGPQGDEGNGEILGGWPLVLMMIKKKPSS